MDQNETRNDGQYLDGHLLVKMAQGGAALLRSNADEVNKLNVFPVPDGDTGDNMRMTIESGIAALEKIDSDDLAEVMKVLSHGMLLGARGNSGVILSQFFAGVSKGLESYEKADATAIGNALSMGVKQAYLSVMTPTEGTILTVARESVEYAVAHITEESDLRSFFADLMKEMYASLQRTPELLATLKEAGVVDSGGAGLFYIMNGFNKVLNGETIDLTAAPAPAAPAPDITAFGPDSEMTYGYCTELLLQLQNGKVDAENFDNKIITDFLVSVGDSVVSFKTGTIVKLHVHTKTPEKVLAFCRQFGEFLTVKIENMSVQHSETVKEEIEAEQAVAEQPRKRYGMVAVAAGDGVKETFLQLGVDAVVDGGQTQNPSTADFLAAFGKVRAEHIFVFPNNGNIIMAAKQAAEIYEGAVVHVIESRDLGAGYTALATADLDEADPAALEAALNEATARAATGYVSPAIRDAELNGVTIKNGDFIGFVGKEMMIADPVLTQTAAALVDKMLTGTDKYMLTVFVGKDAAADERTALEQHLAAAHPAVERYFIDGGQDVYPFIFVAE